MFHQKALVIKPTLSSSGKSVVFVHRPKDFLEGGKYLKNGPTAERHERRGAKWSKLTTAVAAESSSSGRNDSSNKNE